MVAQVIVPYRFGFDFKVGVRSSDANVMGTAIAGDPATVGGAGGGTGEFSLQQLQSQQDLEEQLAISADASAGVGLFSASDRFDFVKKCKIQSYSMVLLIQATQQLGFQSIDAPAINDDASAVVGNTDLFFKRYGDRFVRGIASGGQFFGVIRIDCRSEETRSSIENALSGSYGPFSADVQVKLHDAITTSFATTEVFVHYEGGGISTLPQTAQELIDAANSWNNSVQQNAKPYLVMLAPYDVAAGPAPPSDIDIEHQKEILQRCAQLRSTQLESLNQVEFVLDPNHSDDFESFDANSLNTVRANLGTDLDIIAKAADYALSNANDAMAPEDYARTKLNLPGYVLTVLPAMPKLKPGHGKYVPNITGMDFNQAEDLVNSQGFIYRLLGLNGPYDGGKVYSQRPAAGVYVAPGTRVTAWALTAGVVPENAVLRDSQYGTSGPVLPDDLPIPPHPLFGGGYGTLPPGSTPPPAQRVVRPKEKRHHKNVPNITGMDFNQAEDLVNSQGFIYRLLALVGPYDGGKVYSQRPAAGVHVAPGTRVTAWCLAAGVVPENFALRDDELGSGSTLPDDLPIPPHPLMGGGYGTLPPGSLDPVSKPAQRVFQRKSKPDDQDGPRLQLTAVCPGSRENSVTVVFGATKCQFGIGNPKNVGTTCTLFISALDGHGNVLSFPDGTSDLQLAPGESISHYYPPSGTQTIVFVCHEECVGQAVLEFDKPNA
jgi:hypothetical protein